MWAPLGDLGVCESGDVGGVELLEFNGGAPAQRAMASLPVVEDLPGTQRSHWLTPRGSSIACGPGVRGCMRAQKDSMTALS
jgi:hypothetical protein